MPAMKVSRSNGIGTAHTFVRREEHEEKRDQEGHAVIGPAPEDQQSDCNPDEQKAKFEDDQVGCKKINGQVQVMQFLHNARGQLLSTRGANTDRMKSLKFGGISAMETVTLRATTSIHAARTRTSQEPYKRVSGMPRGCAFSAFPIGVEDRSNSVFLRLGSSHLFSL